MEKARNLWLPASLIVVSLTQGTCVLAEYSGKNSLEIRGVEQAVYFYAAPAHGVRSAPKVLFAPGDLGMHGLAITIAETIASWGYDVYALDTRRYLSGFTGKTPLTVTDVMGDFRQIAAWMHPGPGERISLVGWSEGAGLCLLAAASEENKRAFSGLVVFGLTETNALTWRWSDLLPSTLRKRSTDPEFGSLEFLSRVAPSPLVMIQSTGDQYVSVEAARRLFAAAKEPKRFVLIDARNHRFEGNQQGLFKAIREGLEWLNPNQQ
jgi:alpha-beta hydrolase superfamily lysophospholipase